MVHSLQIRFVSAHAHVFTLLPNSYETLLFYLLYRIKIYLHSHLVDDFFNCSSHLFLLIEFHCIFSICYKILEYYVYYYCVLIRKWWAVGTYFVYRVRCISFYTHASSSVFLSYFILAFPMPEFLGKHSCMSSTFPMAILNATSFFFQQCNYNCTMCIRGEKSKYTCVIVRLYRHLN